MKKLITYETLRNFTYSNDVICSEPIKGIAVEFFGLGGMAMFQEDTPFGKELASEGIINIIPYNNPWAWMNRQAIEMTDEIIDVLCEKYDLPAGIPVVASGGSMGGLAALVYTKYAERTPVACVTNCPVCDLLYHYTERPDLPRTLYSAFYNYNADSIDEAMKTASPLHLSPEMPDIKYYNFHCDADTAVNIDMHSKRFVEAMKHRNITYHIISGKNHCDLTDDMAVLFRQYIKDSILNPNNCTTLNHH